jgi:hypothetical protein
MPMKKVEKLRQEVMKKYIDGEFTVKELSLNGLEDAIVNRSDYIVRTIWELQGQKDNLEWWDFGNEGGKDGPKGYFDEKEYREYVEYAYGTKKWKNILYRDSFPTKWIWEDFEDSLAKEVKQFVEKETKEREDAKNKRVAKEIQSKALIASALAKLTKEEAKAMGFRKV